jgi:hypothetical protein
MSDKTWGRADLHIHSDFSDGVDPIPEILDWVAQKTKLDVIAITDHQTIEGAQLAQKIAAEKNYNFEVIIGEEISARDGEIVGLFLKNKIEKQNKAEQAIEEIHKQGGIAFAPHPFDRLGFVIIPKKFLFGKGVARKIYKLKVDAVEVERALPHLPFDNLRARIANKKIKSAGLANSDAHIKEMIGKNYTLFSGQTASDLKQGILNKNVYPQRKYSYIESLFKYAVHIFQFIKQSRLHAKKS